MTRSILAVLAATVTVTIVAGTGCNSSGVGDPCTPEAEYDTSFLGFDFHEVNVESRSFQCQTRLCLANHFQGRVTCPYGQASDGTKAVNQSMDEASGSTGCQTPINLPVDGLVSGSTTPLSPPTGGTAPPGAHTGPGAVYPNCTDRVGDNAVYCSCRCANSEGQTNDGAIYCACPTGFSCTQLISSIGSSNAQLSGAYCIKNGTDFNPATSCATACGAQGGGNCGASAAQNVPGQ